MVALYTHVQIELVSQSGEVEHMSLDIVPEQQADFYAGFLGENTPLGRTLLGRRAGEVAPYRVADYRQARILSVSASSREAAKEASEKRKATKQEATRQIERTNAMIFASTV